MLLSTQNFQQDSQLKTAVLHLPGEGIKLPIISGTEDEQAIDITSLRNKTGYIALESRLQQYQRQRPVSRLRIQTWRQRKSRRQPVPTS